MMITYLLSFMDKVALSQASIFGILKDDVFAAPFCHEIGQNNS